MKVVIISDCGEILHVYTIRRFVQEVNKQYGSEYFKISDIEQAINWYSDEMVFGIDLIDIEVSKFDEICFFKIFII